MCAKIVAFPATGTHEEIGEDLTDRTCELCEEEVSGPNCFEDANRERLFLGSEEAAIEYLRKLLTSLPKEQRVEFRGPAFHEQPDGSCMCRHCRNDLDVLTGCIGCSAGGSQGRYETPVSILRKWRAIAEMDSRLVSRLNPIDLYEEMFNRAGAPVPPMCSFVGSDGYMYGLWPEGQMARTKKSVGTSPHPMLWVAYQDWERTEWKVTVAEDQEIDLNPWLSRDTSLFLEVEDMNGEQPSIRRMSLQEWANFFVDGPENCQIRFLAPSERIEGIRRWNRAFSREYRPFDEYSFPTYYDAEYLLEMTDSLSMEMALRTEGLRVDIEGNFQCPACLEMVNATWGCFECERKGDSPPILNPWKMVAWTERLYEEGFLVTIDELSGLFVERSGEVEAPVAWFVDEKGGQLLIFGNSFAGYLRQDDDTPRRPRACDLVPWHSVVQYPFHLEGDGCVLHDDGQIVVWDRSSRENGEDARMMSLSEFQRVYGLTPLVIQWENQGIRWWPDAVENDPILTLEVLRMSGNTLEDRVRELIPELGDRHFWLSRGFRFLSGQPICRECSAEFDLMAGCKCKSSKEGPTYTTIQAFFDAVRRVIAERGLPTEVTEEYLMSGLRDRIGMPVP